MTKGPLRVVQGVRSWAALLLFLTPLGLAAPLTAASRPTPRVPDTYARQPGIDAVHYVFRLALEDASDEIVGEATVQLRFVTGGVSSFWLDLASVDETGKGMTVSAVTSDGVALAYRHEADRLHIELAAPPAQGTLRSFTIAYQGVPATGLMIGENRYEERTFFSWNWPNKAREWLPMIDHPSDKATSEFIITAPDRYQVVANGLLQEERDLGDGRRVTHWKQSLPIASWLNAIGVAQFASRHFGNFKGIPLQTWVFHQDRDAGIGSFDDPTRKAIDFFNENIGPYPYEKLADVQAAGGGGGTEHASVIFYGQNTVTGEPATGVVAHEIAHQWFGDAITESDWDDVWLSEGFATYFTHLYYEHYYGRDELVERLRNDIGRVLEAERANPGRAVIHDNLDDMSQVLQPGRIIYQKGGWVLHMLRGQIGTQTFWQGIREYYRLYRDRNVSTDDFRRVMEEASDQDLGWFFAQWTKRDQSPVVRCVWSYDAARRQVVVELSQTQAGAPYRLPLDIGIVAADGTMSVQRVELDSVRQRFEVGAEAAPTDVELDPDTWILMDATVSPAGDPPSPPNP